MKVSWRAVFWYTMVVAAWVAVLDSGWLVLWGPDASWHRWFFVLAWGGLTVRRVLCDLALLSRHSWWAGWTAGMRDAPPGCGE